MLTKDLVLEMIEEYKIEDKKTERVPHYYKRNGKILERSYPDYVTTEKYKELGSILRSDDAKIFKCGECGKKVGYFDLEYWTCDFNKNNYICSCCYEDEMDEDL